MLTRYRRILYHRYADLLEIKYLSECFRSGTLNDSIIDGSVQISKLWNFLEPSNFYCKIYNIEHDLMNMYRDWPYEALCNTSAQTLPSGPLPGIRSGPKNSAWRGAVSLRVNGRAVSIAKSGLGHGLPSGGARRVSVVPPAPDIAALLWP
jgi:hypothetical protein